MLQTLFGLINFKFLRYFLGMKFYFLFSFILFFFNPLGERLVQCSSEFGDMTFCHFGPKFKVIQPEVRSEKWGGKDPCTGSVKVQGVYWECARSDKVESKIFEFQNKLRKQAQGECQKHCARRGSRCVGELRLSRSCGLQTDQEDSVIMGKRMGCRQDCSGQSFAYCSLYDAAFRSEDEDRIKKQTPNCYCKQR